MPRGPRKLSVSFGTASLSHYGGVYLLHRFFSRIGFRDALARKVAFSQRNNRYTVGELVLAVVYPMMLGLSRLETTSALRTNGVFKYLTGLPSYPDATTLRRFLLRMAPAALPAMRRLHDGMLQQMSCRPKPPKRLIFDVDSTVLVLYGKQEQAKVGYNPAKRRRPSYHPLLCFESISKDFWHGELRPGDAHTARGVIDLLDASLTKVPDTVGTVLLRADKGFYDHKLVDWCEQRRVRFVVVARLTPPIKRIIPGLKYTSPRPGLEVSEFTYQPARWSRPHRFIVVRRTQPEEASQQLTLFQLGRYHYQVLVTNLRLAPLATWKFYNDRAGAELLIRQLKGDYALGSIPSRHFFANEAYFHLLLLAYNLINWFKRLCLPQDLQTATLQSLRQHVLLMPALLSKAGNRPRLSLPTGGTSERAWRYALREIERLRP